MTKRYCLLAAVVTLIFLGARPAGATIHYKVSLAHPEEHLFHVSMTVPDAKDSLTVKMPAWNALYQIRDFAHHVQQVRATDAAKKSLEIRKLDKQTWKVTGNGTVTLDYATYWDEPGAFNAQLSASHAFMNLALVLFYVPDRRGEEVRLELVDVPAEWKIAVALKTISASTFSASNYDALVDAPVEAGKFEEFRLEANGARLRVVVHGDGWQREALSDTVQRVVTYETTLMREVPFEEYTFIYHFGQGGGGMEHANSTAISLGAGGNPNGVTAHEFFHLWNVKRIRPQSLEPVDYSQENWTRALWFAEGVTSTYGNYTLVRSGLWTQKQFYDALAREVTALEARPARQWKSVEEASLDAWYEKYSVYRGAPFSISYYNKGQLVGVLLDVLIRDATNNRKSLDDVLRQLNDNFAHRGRFYNDSADIRAAAEKIAGRSFEEFFRRYVSGVDELPCAEVLAKAGLLLKAREGQGPERRYDIEEDSNAGEKQRRIREGLLKGATD